MMSPEVVAEAAGTYEAVVLTVLSPETMTPAAVSLEVVALQNLPRWISLSLPSPRLAEWFYLVSPQSLE